MQLQDKVTSQGHIAASLQQPRKHVITQKHNLHTSFVITLLQETQTKAASKKVFMNYNVQLKGEGGLNYNSTSFFLQGGIPPPPPLQSLVSFIYLQLGYE